MSIGIVFTPVIPKTYTHNVWSKPKPKVKRAVAALWSDSDLMRLINLRAIGVSFKACAPLLKRTMAACVAAVDSNNLYGAISTRRNVLIKEILR